MEKELRRLLKIYKSLVTADALYKIERFQKEREMVEMTGVLEQTDDKSLDSTEDIEFFENKIVEMIKGNKI